MIFDSIPFLKPDRPLNKTYTGHNYAPMFRKTFRLAETGEAKLYVCGLGYGLYWLNGVPVTEDKLTAPVSDYTKTLWYSVYDVTDLLREGENCFAVWCGNGWFNEEFRTSWNFNEAPWRDVPKFILRLDVCGATQVSTGEGWKCLPESPIRFNALRSGETFDARDFDENWTAADYDDSAWENAVIDDDPPTGTFRECLCEPIRECAVYPAECIRQTGEDRFVWDCGQNMSGYIRLTACENAGQAGQELTIRYAEQLCDDGSLQLNRMFGHYRESPFQTDRLTLSGRKLIWSPRFCYHGFRYIEITGVTDPAGLTVEGVFVHQAVETRTEFSCSDEFLNKLFRAGQMSTWSNLFYMVTDCPTREKLGWANDAQSSAEQILTNFKAERLLNKWLTDVYDAMRDDGAMPGIIPTGGWGYEWGNGPVSDGLLFEIPDRLYRHTGLTEPLIRSLPYFDRYFAYLDSRKDADGYVRFGLDDWARPPRRASDPPEDPMVPAAFINAVLAYHFCEIAELAAQLSGKDPSNYREMADGWKRMIRRDFVNPDGTCTLNRQTAAAMLIYYGLTDDPAPLADQLKKLVEAADFHHDCGMVGLRRLYYALNKAGLAEYAYKVITAQGYPSYREWMDGGATTLWEYWNTADHADSKNHQMYSDFMSWIIKTILGVRQDEDVPGFRSVNVDPVYLSALTEAHGSCDTTAGKIAVAWKKENGEVNLTITVPEGMEVFHRGKKLERGENRFAEAL